MVIAHNQVHLVEVWKDDYKQIFFHRNKRVATIAKEVGNWNWNGNWEVVK